MAILPLISKLRKKGYIWRYPEEPRDIRKACRLALKEFGDSLIQVYRNPNIDIWVFDIAVDFKGKYPIKQNIFSKKLNREFPKLNTVVINKYRNKVRKPKELSQKEILEIEFKEVQEKILKAKRSYYKYHTSIMSDYEFDMLEKYSFKLAKALGFRANSEKGPKKNEAHHVHWVVGYKPKYKRLK